MVKFLEDDLIVFVVAWDPYFIGLIVGDFPKVIPNGVFFFNKRFFANSWGLEILATDFGR